MARDHARVHSAIWSDPDFRELAVPAQHMYILLLSQPRLTFVGILDYLPKRFAQLSAKATVRSVTSAIAALEERGYVIHDEEHEELLIRSFVRRDGLLKSPNVTKAMVTDFNTVGSSVLRDVLVEELRRSYDEAPEMKGWPAVQETAPALWSLITAKGSRKGSANG